MGASAMVVVNMPFKVLCEGIRHSRKPWIEAQEGKPPKECASALQVDDGMEIEDHVPTTILNEDPERDDNKLYSVACDTYVLRKNPVFREYCQNFPDRVPPADCGRPLLPILVEFFCTGMWRQLIDGASNQVMSQASIAAFKHSVAKGRLNSMDQTESELKSFDRGSHKVFQLLDENGDGNIDTSELQDKVRSILGDRLSSNIVVEQLMQMVDEDA